MRGAPSATAFQPTGAVDVCAPCEVKKCAFWPNVCLFAFRGRGATVERCECSRDGDLSAGSGGPLRPAASRGAQRPARGVALPGLGHAVSERARATGQARREELGSNAPAQACSRLAAGTTMLAAGRLPAVRTGFLAALLLPSPGSESRIAPRVIRPLYSAGGCGLEMERGEQRPWEARGASRGLQESAGLPL